jgi:hypothetical protein
MPQRRRGRGRGSRRPPPPMRASMNRRPMAPVRHFVLIDVENVAGLACPTYLDLANLHAQLHAVLPDLDEAFRVVACNHRAAKTVAFEFPGARQRWRSGRDGADFALLEEMKDQRVMRRFGRVTVCSGDWRFSKSLAELAVLGLETTVVALEGHLSKRLSLAAQQVVILPGTDALGAARERPDGRRWPDVRFNHQE